MARDAKDFKDAEFNGMVINPMSIKKGEYLADRYPQIKSFEGYAELKHRPDVTAIMKYVVLAYSYKNNPLVTHYPHNIIERRSVAAELADYPINPKTGKFSEMVQTMINGQDPLVNDFAFGFLKYQNNMLWSIICTQQNRFWEAQHLIIRPITQDDDKKMLDAANLKSKLGDDCDKMRGQLNDLWAELLGDNKDVIADEAPISPETMQKRY